MRPLVNQLVLWSALLVVLPAQAKTKLAVMDLSDQTRTLDTNVRESLTDALRTQLAGSGQFIVIDKSRQAAALKKLIAEQKKESYKACYDNRCQVPLGQALAADSILRTRLTKVGSSYVLNAELVDLEKEAVTTAAQAQVAAVPRAGRDDRLLQAISSVARQLTGGEAVPAPVPVPVPAPRPATPDPGVTSNPNTYDGAFARPAQRAETAEEIAAREARTRELREQQQRQAEEARLQAQARAGQDELRKRRSTYLIYGWLSVITGGLIAASGVYYVAGKARSQRDEANQATSPEELKTSADEAKKSQTTGGVLIGLGGAAVGLGALLILLAPKAVDRPVNVAGTKLDRLPSGGVTTSGVLVRWGGRF